MTHNKSFGGGKTGWNSNIWGDNNLGNGFAEGMNYWCCFSRAEVDKSPRSKYWRQYVRSKIWFRFSTVNLGV